MSKKRKADPTFRVKAQVTVTVEVEITAATLDEALALANGMDEKAFVEPKGDLMDWQFELVGVYK